MGIPDALVDEVRNRADLVEIVAEFTQLKRSGRTFRGPCPLHGGEGPNFSVDPNRNIFKCFVCGESGDIFSFPMKHLGLGFTDAIRWVAERVGIEIPEDSRPDDQPDPHAHFHDANAFAAEWFRAQLLDPEEGNEAREYLDRRGITPDARERFGIGWAPGSWGALADAAKAHGIRQDTLLALGLMKESRDGRRDPYDAFRGRVIFPIESLGGRVVAFGGRVIAPIEDHVPKYLNSPESEVYHKGDLLYGLRWSRGAIRKEEVALVVEGYMDYVSLASHGVENVVAPLGTALTSSQGELISRYASRVILLYDSDAAGLKATFRSADELLRHGIEVLVATLPNGEDPDTLVRRGGPDHLRGFLNDAVDVLERKIQILERRDYFSSIAGRRRAVDALLPTARAASDEVLRGIYIDRIAERTGVPKDTVAREVVDGIARDQARSAPRRPAERPAVRPAPPQPATPTMGPERNLILLLLRDEQWIEKAAERLGPADFRDEVYREIFSELVHVMAEGGDTDHTEWLGGMGDAVLRKVEELRSDPEGWNLTYPGRFFEENVREIETRNQRQRLTDLDRRLERADPEEQGALLAEKMELRKSMDRSGIRVSLRSGNSSNPHG